VTSVVSYGTPYGTVPRRSVRHFALHQPSLATGNGALAFQGRHRNVIRDWGRINYWLDCLVRATEPYVYWHWFMWVL